MHRDLPCLGLGLVFLACFCSYSSRIPAHRDLTYMHNEEPRLKCAMHEVENAKMMQNSKH
jgi:hypothetical protein